MRGFTRTFVSFAPAMAKVAAELLLGTQLNHRGIFHRSEMTRPWTWRLRAQQHHWHRRSCIAMCELSFETFAGGAQCAASA